MNTPRLAISALRLGSFLFQGLSDVSYTCIVYPHNYRQRHVNTSRITVFTPDDRALLYEYIRVRYTRGGLQLYLVPRPGPPSRATRIGPGGAEGESPYDAGHGRDIEIRHSITFIHAAFASFA